MPASAPASALGTAQVPEWKMCRRQPGAGNRPVQHHDLVLLGWLNSKETRNRGRMARWQKDEE